MYHYENADIVDKGKRINWALLVKTVMNIHFLWLKLRNESVITQILNIFGPQKLISSIQIHSVDNV